MKKRKLKLSDTQFKKYLLDKLVDEEGNKVSVRKLIETNEFMETTGLFQIDNFGNRKPCSVGTMSDYINTKYKLDELTLFEHHKLITKRIKEEVVFNEWSNCRNRGKNRKNNLFSDDVLKNTFIKYFKNANALPKNYQLYTFEGLKSFVISLYDSYFGDGEGKKEVDNFYDYYNQGLIEV